MLLIARPSFVIASLLSLTALAVSSLVIASGCRGDDAEVQRDASAPERDGTSEAGSELIDASSPDGSPPDAEADAKADAGDQMAFDAFTVSDQGAIETTGTIDSVASTGFRIVQGSGGWFCGGTGLVGQSSIELLVATTASSVTPGTYTITNGMGATTRSEATFQLIDTQCRSLASHAAESGSITITSVDATSVKGIYDIVFGGFGENGRAVGGFIAPICNAGLWGPHANCQP